MSTKIRIPDELNVLKERLVGLETLLVTKKWERAAIVYAFTEIGGPRDSTPILPPRMNIRHFADLGIAGLSTQKSVQRYRRAWQDAIDNKWAMHVLPGDDEVVLPEEPFPAWPFGAQDVAEAIASDPEAATAARGALTTLLKDKHREGRPRQWDTPQDEAIGALDRARALVERAAETIKDQSLSEAQRTELAIRGDDVSKAVQSLLAVMAPKSLHLVDA